MRYLRFGAFLCLLFGFGLRVEAQEFFARDLYAGAERNTIIAGEQIQFWAFALGWDGTFRTDGFDWGSSNEDVATVTPSGLVTGTGIGTTQIWTAVAGRWTQLTIQVLPLRIDIEGASGEMAPGDSVQLTFVARDINEDGLFYATAEGRVTVWAIINFWGAQAGQTRRFTASTEIEIKRQPDFRLTRLLAGDPTEGSFKIDVVNWRPFVANDAGQLALVASLGGIADGIVTYNNGNLDLLASTGTPGFSPGSVTREFNNLAMNDRGDVFVTSWADWGRGTLTRISPSGSSVLLVEGQTVGLFQDIWGLTLTPHSVNEQGDVVLRVHYRLSAEDPNNHAGIIKVTDESVQVVWGSSLPLTDFPDGYEIDWDRFGVDGSGTAYFTVWHDETRAIYRADGLSLPQKVVMIGAKLRKQAGTLRLDDRLGSTIRNVDGFAVSPNGTVATGVWLAGGRTGPIRYLSDGTIALLETNWLDRILAVNDAGQVVFEGDAGSNYGIYRWDGGTATLLLQWGDVVDGSTVNSFQNAWITASGTVYASIGTPENDYLLVETESRQVLVKNGDRVNAQVHPAFTEFVRGSESGLPYFFTGGSEAAIFEVSSSGLIPVWVGGDMPVGHPAGGGLEAATRNPRGDLYLASGWGVFRHAGELETLVEYPVTVEVDASDAYQLGWTDSWWGSSFMAVNDAGMLVWRAGPQQGSESVAP